MTMDIKPDTKIIEFQSEFITLFPNLKIEFFTRPHEEGGTSWSKYMHFKRTKTLGEIGQVQGESTLEFTPQMTTGAFEQALWQKYALAVQVFRKSMGTYIESTKSDKWTLEEQNKDGYEASHNIMQMVYEQRTNED